LTSETQQKILKALQGMLEELKDWLKGLGCSETQVLEIYRQILLEKGMAARILATQTANVFPVIPHVQVNPDVSADFELIRSGAYGDRLLEMPEPDPGELEAFLESMKDALPKLRLHFSTSSKFGPRLKRGGRPKELNDPATREEIRSEIKKLRGPGTKLRDLYIRLGRKHGVSPSTIKRIREEELDGKS